MGSIQYYIQVIIYPNEFKEKVILNSFFLYSQDPEIIKQIEDLHVIENLTELVGRGAFDIRKGVR